MVTFVAQDGRRGEHLVHRAHAELRVEGVGRLILPVGRPAGVAVDHLAASRDEDCALEPACSRLGVDLRADGSGEFRLAQPANRHAGWPGREVHFQARDAIRGGRFDLQHRPRHVVPRPLLHEAGDARRGPGLDLHDVEPAGSHQEVQVAVEAGGARRKGLPEERLVIGAIAAVEGAQPGAKLRLSLGLGLLQGRRRLRGGGLRRPGMAGARRNQQGNGQQVADAVS
jgi:hypothetical protein